MILKIDERARRGAGYTGPALWRYIADVTEVIGLGFYPWDDFGPYRDDHVVIAGALPVNPGEYAEGVLHQVAFRDGTYRYYWLNVPEAFLMTEAGDTVDRLATGGGSVNRPDPRRTEWSGPGAAHVER